MSLTKVKLPENVIADLYKQSLVVDETVVVEPAKPRPEQQVQPQTTAMPESPAPAAAKPAHPTPPAAATVYKSLGNNAKNITIIVHFANEVFLPETQLQFLTKMLGACKLNLADVAIVNHAASPVNIEHLKLQLYPTFVLLFGVEPTDIQLPINFPAYKEQPYAGTTYLYAPALEVLNQESAEAKQAKRKLWDCLKRMFV
jgi:hypothetical protein